MTDATKIKCRRCNGKGFTGHVVVYAGVPGTCFACAGYGEVYKDKFYREFGVGKKFYGITWSRYLNANNPNNGVFKMMATKVPEFVGQRKDLRGRVTEIIQCTEITEEQARKFWGRYGERTKLGGVRVSDFDAQ